jgi:hypothetical protein
MAQTGFTPIQLYRTTTPFAAPLAVNLAAGELAINLADKKLYAKDAGGSVFLLADASSGFTTATNLSGGVAGSMPYQIAPSSTSFLSIGTANQVLQVNAGQTAPEWVNTSGTGNVARTTGPNFTTPSLGAATATSINGLTLTSSTGALTVANGKTLTANSTLTLAGVDGKTLTVNSSLTLTGTDATTMTFPTTSATLARTDAGQTFTGTNTFSSAPQVSTLTNTRVVYAGASGVLQDSANLTFDGTSLTLGGNPTLSAGTANGVLYLNGSKVVTSGSGLTFDGTNFQTSGTIASVTENILTPAGKGIAFSGDPTRIFTPEDNVSGGLLQWAAGGVLRFNAGPSSELMRLTSTGLGIGTNNPTEKLEILGNILAVRTGGSKLRLADQNNEVSVESLPVGAGSQMLFKIENNERMRLDSSGNLGLGVTPSAWSQGRAIEVAGTGYGIWNGTASIYSIANAYFDSGFKYANTGAQASHYYQFQGQHVWSTAASGTAGNAISFSQVMTLTSAGILLLGTTNAPTASGALISVYGTSDASIQITKGGVVAARLKAVSTALAFGVDGADGDTERARIPAAGGMVVGTAALATNATDGFLYVPTCAGTPTGTPTTQTGTAPIVVDTTNNKLYFYSGGAWRDAGP